MSNPDGVLTVSQLTSAVKEILETGFPAVVVEGEISGLRSTTGKHLYFSLKDDQAVLKVVWFGWNSRASTPPADGQQVRITGRLAVYEPQGVYQLVASHVEAVGLGDLLARLERLKRQLDAEGLFASERKRPLPQFPSVIGLVTSPSGAALQDMLRIFLAADVKSVIRIFPAAVQGSEAPVQLSSMIEYASKAALCDVLVVGRGGGSVEDLLAFSDERVVRAVADSPIPVISAVGHEIDTPLCDLAADVRAPTPTAAAQILSLPWQNLAQELKQVRQIFADSVRARIDRARLTLSEYRSDRLRDAFHRLLEPAYQRFDYAREALRQGWVDRMTALRHRFDLSRASLAAADPRVPLERGYVLVRSASGTVLRSVTETGAGEELAIQFRDGRALSVVKETVHEEL